MKGKVRGSLLGLWLVQVGVQLQDRDAPGYHGYCRWVLGVSVITGLSSRPGLWSQPWTWS